MRLLIAFIIGVTLSFAVANADRLSGFDFCVISLHIFVGCLFYSHPARSPNTSEGE